MTMEQDWLARDMQFKAFLDCKLNELRSFLADADCDHDAGQTIWGAFNAFDMYAKHIAEESVHNSELILLEANR